MNLQKISLLFILALSFSTLKAQKIKENAATPDELRALIESKIRVPREISEKNITYFFTIKFSLSDHLEIKLSKYAPKEIATLINNPALYNKVDWAKVLGRPLRLKEIIIVPVKIYAIDGVETAKFFEYTLDDVFNYADEKSAIYECNILQTVLFKYGVAMH